MKSLKIDSVKKMEVDNTKTIEKNSRRRSIHIPSRKRKKNETYVRDKIAETSKELLKRNFKTNSFSESFRQLLNDWNNLLNYSSLSRDPKFLCRIAINIKQIQFDFARIKHPQQMKKQAEGIAHFISTPLGAPSVPKKTLLEAADSFSEQEPKHSDLANLLDYMAHLKVKPESRLPAQEV